MLVPAAVVDAPVVPVPAFGVPAFGTLDGGIASVVSPAITSPAPAAPPIGTERRPVALDRGTVTVSTPSFRSAWMLSRSASAGSEVRYRKLPERCVR